MGRVPNIPPGCLALIPGTVTRRRWHARDHVTLCVKRYKVANQLTFRSLKGVYPDGPDLAP